MPYKDPAKRLEYMRRYKAAKRKEWFDENGPCVKCGSWDGLEADHIDASSKALNPRELWTLSPSNPRRVAELAKCQVLCRPCHLEKRRAYGEWARGENANHSLTEGDVLAIRRSGASSRELAQQYGVGTRHIQKLRSGLMWKHLN